jgi:ribosomal protein L17
VEALAAVALAERILALGEGVATLIEKVVSAVEQQHADRAGHYARLAALGTSSGLAAYEASKNAGPG